MPERLPQIMARHSCFLFEALGLGFGGLYLSYTGVVRGSGFWGLGLYVVSITQILGGLGI